MKYFIIFISFFSINLYSQNGFNIQLVTNNLKNQQIEFGICFGSFSKESEIETKMINREKDTLNFITTKKVKNGFYYIKNLKTNEKFDLIIENNDQIQINIDENFQNVIFTNSSVNTEFFKNKNSIIKNPENFTTFQNKQLKLFIELQKRINDIKSINKNDLFDQKSYYFDLDWKNQNMIISPNYYKFLNTYFSIACPNADSYYENAQYLLKKIPEGSDTYYSTLNWFFSNLEYRKFENYEQIYSKIAIEFLNQNASKNEFIQYSQIITNLKKIENLPIGSEAPKFSLNNQLN